MCDCGDIKTQKTAVADHRFHLVDIFFHAADTITIESQFVHRFQHPRMLETMDKIRFDCYCVGSVKENIDEMEPVIRNSSLLSFDISAIAHAYAPANFVSPNGLNGEEACVLMRYAGMSPNINSVGIYGYDVQHDKDELTAKQIAH